MTYYRHVTLNLTEKQGILIIIIIIIIIIILNLYSAIMPLGGYRGVGTCRTVDIYTPLKHRTSQGSWS